METTTPEQIDATHCAFGACAEGAPDLRRLVLSLCLLAVLLQSASSLVGCTGRSVTTPPSAVVSTPAESPTRSPTPSSPVVFAVIGDYGTDDRAESQVAKLVASWNPAYVITTGDDYYAEAGGRGTGKYDESTGAHYGAWLKDISTTGSRAPVGKAAINAFFPALGNHDYSDATPSPETYRTYFTLPGADFANTSGNERYYDFVQGPVHFYVLNSNAEEPDGTSSTSAQAQWLRTQLTASGSTWNVVVAHHPPYSSDKRWGSNIHMQWPFAEWGADVVIAGHYHAYERVMRDGIVYFVNGLGGAERQEFGPPVEGSAVRYARNWGAQKVTVTDGGLDFAFYDIKGTLVDHYLLPTSGPAGN